MDLLSHGILSLMKQRLGLKQVTIEDVKLLSEDIPFHVKYGIEDKDAMPIPETSIILIFTAHPGRFIPKKIIHKEGALTQHNYLRIGIEDLKGLNITLDTVRIWLIHHGAKIYIPPLDLDMEREK